MSWLRKRSTPMSDAQLTELVRNVATAECRRIYKRERVHTAVLLQAVYMTIFGACTIALKDAGVDDETVMGITGLAEEIVTVMNNNYFITPHNFRTTI